jgi:hypothetical protein
LLNDLKWDLDMKTFLTRRRLLISLGLGTLVLMAYEGLRWTKWRYLFRSKWDLPTQLERFYQLSALLLGVTLDSMDRDLSDRIWRELTSTDAATANLMDLYLRTLGNNEGVNLQTAHWSDANKKFAATILNIWYTGTIKDDQGNARRLFYEQSGMFSFYFSVRPAPGNCAGAFGYWTKPPEISAHSLKPVREENYV